MHARSPAAKSVVVGPDSLSVVSTSNPPFKVVFLDLRRRILRERKRQREMHVDKQEVDTTSMHARTC